ncbi:type III-B CRISPR module RAMP protein Cmr4 [Arthrospira platensis FACHB-439]|uniref:CRISPR-associated RAMP protein, Cmr4 family n=1 Tax=Limnospira maxima CS-328 TaxID=513049 RepID=B5W4P3_LIMMA|nr:type III-B CRISPR module RAMP protein Cmr4 [Limnospira maxima]EDZ93485.1 CRISPR-associated RAMP protein, Cmr4 family [Limnospira maxima CS-328]MBD2671086.1 type III-B CRISPR module RAMP protein Cmr4 [Arthrospira platensis FACHB-439]MDC0836686.1 type III-B CRISPR module RAMP protein Cmr4 [Limnoraphis robusta]
MTYNYAYLYLLSPLHTGGTTQEGNLLGIARESHTNLPYLPSSSIRGRIRASEGDTTKRNRLFGTTLEESSTLEQGDIWIGDGSLLWLPVPSLSHGIVWISSPMLLRRWGRFQESLPEIPEAYSTNLDTDKPAYLKDAIIKPNHLRAWSDWEHFMPEHTQTQMIERVLILPDQHCSTLIQMSLWRQVKIKLDQHKSVDGGFRYEEAIPPDTLMYFPWGLTAKANGTAEQSESDFKKLIESHELLQIGGQESLGRGFVQQWLDS